MKPIHSYNYIHLCWKKKTLIFFYHRNIHFRNSIKKKGIHVPADGYFAEVRRLCNKHNV